jgi:hypothetical protein
MSTVHVAVVALCAFVMQVQSDVCGSRVLCGSHNTTSSRLQVTKGAAAVQTAPPPLDLNADIDYATLAGECACWLPRHGLFVCCCALFVGTHVANDVLLLRWPVFAVNSQNQL